MPTKYVTTEFRASCLCWLLFPTVPPSQVRAPLRDYSSKYRFQRGREMTHTQMGHAGDSSSCWLNCPNQVKWIHGKLGSGTLCWACKSWRRLLELGESSCLDKGYIQVVPIILFFLIILSNPRLTSVLRLLCHHPESFGLVKSGIQWNYQASRLRHRRQGCRQDNQILLGI